MKHVKTFEGFFSSLFGKKEEKPAQTTTKKVDNQPLFKSEKDRESLERVIKNISDNFKKFK